MSLAEALTAGGSERQAALELQAARAVLERIEVAPTSEQPTARVSVPQREGDYWSLVYEGRTLHVRDLKGMRYLARLLAHPGREFHVLDLVAAENPAHPSADSPAGVISRAALGDAGEMLDDRAKSAYRRRLIEIEADIEQARALGDTDRAAQADIRTRLPPPRAVTRRRPQRSRPKSRVSLRTCSSCRHPGNPTRDRPHLAATIASSAPISIPRPAPARIAPTHPTRPRPPRGLTGYPPPRRTRAHAMLQRIDRDLTRV